MASVFSNTIKDCFGSEYQVLRMPPNGLCGFSSFAYSLTGDMYASAQIVEDSLCAFVKNPRLFIEGTEFGKRNKNLSIYQRHMRAAVANVAVRPVPSIFWMEDSHISAFAMMHDITVFVYCCERRRWMAYGDTSRDNSGYVCLLFNGSHFDVLEGVDTVAPPVPREVDSQGANRGNMSWQEVEVGQYSRPFVWEWPRGQRDQDSIAGSSSGIEYTYAAMVKSYSPKPSTKPVVHSLKPHQNEPKGQPVSPDNVQSFDCVLCSRTFKSERGLRVHSTKKHEVDESGFSVVVDGAPSVPQTTKAKSRSQDKPDVHTVEPLSGVFSCTVCNKQFNGRQALTLHYFKKHEISSLADIKQLECGKSCSYTVPSNSGKNAPKHSGKSKFCCSVCSEHYTSKRGLSQHVAKVHTKVASTKRNLKQTAVVSTTLQPQQHLNSKTHSTQAEAVDATKVKSEISDPQHTGIEQQRRVSGLHEQFCCSVCKKQFNTNRGLRVHHSKMHKPHFSQSQTDNNLQSALDSTLQNVNKTELCGKKRHSDANRSVTAAIDELYEEYPPLTHVETNETNELHVKLKKYHDMLLHSVNNISTQKLSEEIQDVIADLKQITEVNRTFKWTKADEERLNELNVVCRTLPVPVGWFWAATDDSRQGIFNKKRMELCMEKELEAKVIHCKQCMSTGVLVGLDQVNSEICMDCVTQKGFSTKAKLEEAWAKVRPAVETYPKRVEVGHESEDLPTLTPGEKAIIAVVHPCVTVTKNFIANKKYKQESISLLQNSQNTWSKFLPRSNLQNRFMIVERRFKNSNNKYIIANAAKVKQWLRYLFKNHTEYIRMTANNELELNDEALQALESQSELAEVLYDHEPDAGKLNGDDGVVQTAMESGLSKSEVYTFDKYPNLYLKSQHLVKIKDKGLIEVVEDDSVRQPTYNASANICFPHLYPKGEMSPLDFGDYKLARDLLKKQTLYAHKMADGSYRWNYAEDSIHMMHQYARLTEQTVRAVVGYYISQHPEKVHTPLQSVLKAFKDGMNEDGLLDSQLPDLSGVMSQIPNSRQKWFSERLGIESISRDLGDPNLFITLNMDARAWPDVRQLIFELEYGPDTEMDRNWYEKNTEKYTELLDKYAPQISIYLCRKAKIFLRAFLCGICQIPLIDASKEKDGGVDWSLRDRYENGWYWSRVEFTETRGVQHWHCIAKLPKVLDTALLGRIIHNGRCVRQELKCGNIRQDRTEEAWNMVEMGLLASRYATLFAESLSQASFYTEDMDVDSHDKKKVIDVGKLRKEYVCDYRQGNISVATHPIMRKFNDPECDANQNIEIAKVAAVSCIHNCIQNICGGDEKTGVGCRFSFPKKPLQHTVPAIMQVNAEQMEAQMLLRRTCDRIPNLNRYFLKYWRANHDVTVLIDAAQSMRYATKYVTKSRKQNELMDEVIDYLGKRSNDLMPPNMKQALSNLILADCSHREFLSKQELSYKVMNLPQVQKSFNDVSVVGFYPRANLIQNVNESDVIVYSDRTEYSAYAERCRSDTVCKGFEQKDLECMCLREFAETINYTWKLNKPLEAEPFTPTGKRKVKTRDINSGHWELSKLRKRRHVRWSTVLYSEPAHLYEEVELGKTTSQTLYFDLSVNKRRQLYRAYQELVCYRPWENSPDEIFLCEDIREKLRTSDPEAESRYSLLKLEAYQRKYTELWLAGEVAPCGSQWHRDNQFSYTMYLTSLHNSDVRQDRADNKGIFTARYESADELAEVDVELRPPLSDDVDDNVPSFLNFMPPDTFRGILEQDPPNNADISVAFPMQNLWQEREEMVTNSKVSLFMADPPSPATSRQDMSVWHNRAIDLVTSGEQQITYIYGKAGTGKTEVALHICQQFKGKVQAGAGTGKAASNFRGPTTHAMFGWSQNENRQTVVRANETAKLSRLRNFYVSTEVFIIDEVNAMSAADLGLLDETMSKIFDPEKNRKDADGNVMPFGGKTMVFLGDAAQLRPVCGAAIYDKAVGGTEMKSGRRTFYSSQYKQRTARGQVLYTEYLSRNCIWLEKSFRNKGLLMEILDRVRDGKQTLADLDKLEFMRRKFPDTPTDYGVHYSNESCCVANWLDLWKTCSQQKPPQRMHISKAGYHTTGENDLVVSSLAAIPASQYRFAPDVLCLAEGCEVRLITNLNVSAGLVNSASGTVVKVIYNNADVQDLIGGRHPPAYCIVVNFPQFRGFPVGDERKFPFTNPNWVPLFRQKFLLHTVPSWIRKTQSPSLCYRQQFPIDLSRHITAHRGQGQTWKNRFVSVDLALGSPNNHIPPDIGSVLYVACTRTNELKNLFVSPIFPCIWEKIGRSAQDEARRESEERLRKDAEELATAHGWRDEFHKEQSYVPDYSGNVAEWEKMVTMQTLSWPHDEDFPVPREMDYVEDRADDGTDDIPGWLSPCEHERHIGIDQGVKNFAMVAVDKLPNAVPKVVGAELYDLEHLGLKKRFDAADLVVLLQTKTVLMNWMQQSGCPLLLPRVDRVVVHLEQISVRNKHSKLFTVELGRLLQQFVTVEMCVVKLSQPHIHRASGPMFKLGDHIIQECDLSPAVYTSMASASKRTRAGTGKTGKKKCRHGRADVPSDVEPDSSSDTESEADEQNESEYRKKKRMSSDIFRYFIHADFAQKADLLVDVSEEVQSHWQKMESSREIRKFDDLGDGLLHALNEILCGGSNYRPLVPSTPSLHVNRSVILTVVPDAVYWVVLQCTWNVFTLENIGVSHSYLGINQIYSSRETVELIKCHLDPSARQSLTDFTASPLYTGVEQIKIIVKQLTGSSQYNISNKAAGALTSSTLEAMKSICDEAAGDASRLCVRNTKHEGWLYQRTLPSGDRIQVNRSTGKHTNAILAFLEWAKIHVPTFVEKRPLHMDYYEKLQFFQALRDLSSRDTGSHQMEMLRLSDHVVQLIRSNTFVVPKLHVILADLILIGLNKNGQYVSAIAPSYRQTPSKPKPRSSQS